MTFLIIFLAVTNMAVGYGLAVYLGHGQLPMQIKLGRFRNSNAIAASPSEASSIPLEGNAVSTSTGFDPQAPAVESATEVPASETPIQPQVEQLDLKDLMPGAQPSLKTEVAEEISETEETADLLPDDDVLEDRPEAVSEAASPEEAAGDPDTDAPLAEEESVVEDPAENTVDDPSLDSDILAGINAFRSQLAKMNVTPEPMPVEETSEEPEPATAK